MSADVVCPFHSQGVCTGECASMRERVCITGESDLSDDAV